MNQGAYLLSKYPLTDLVKRIGLAKSRLSEWQTGLKLPGKDRRAYFARELNIPEHTWDMPVTSSYREDESGPITQRLGTRAATSVESAPTSTERPIPASDPAPAITTPATYSEVPPLPPKPALVRVPPFSSLASLDLQEDESEAPSLIELGARPARDELTAQVARLRALIKDPKLTGAQLVQAEAALTRALRQLADLTGELRPSDLQKLLTSQDFLRVFGTIAEVLQRRCPDVIPEITAALGALDTAQREPAQEAA